MSDLEWTDEPPEEPGWYVITYCWDIREGIFSGVAYWDKGWANTLPIARCAGPFDTEEQAQQLEKDYDPEPITGDA